MPFGVLLTSPYLCRVALCLRAAVAVVDLQGQGAQTAELAQVMQGPARLAGKHIIIARGNMLMDAVSALARPSHSHPAAQFCFLRAR